jgi:hypothetical protein
LAAGLAAAAAVVVVSGTAMALGPTTWQKPPEPPGQPLAASSTSLAEYGINVDFGPSVVLSGPTPDATATPLPNSTYLLVGQTPPIATPTPTPTPTPAPTLVPDTVANARTFARTHLNSKQFACVDVLWESESNWNPRAVNATTGAYGIPQSMPASKMATAGRNWRTSPRTQVSWGLQYIAVRYGTACQAWTFRISHGWY